MTIPFASALRASLLLVLLLSTDVCIASQQAAIKTSSSSSSSSPFIQKNYIRGQYDRRRRRRRRTQTTQTTNDTEQQSDGSDDNDDDEDYLPEVNIKKTWLFGAGDLSELNIDVTSSSTSPDNNTTIATNNDTAPTTTTTTTSSSTSTINTNTPTPIEIPSLLTGEYIIDISTGSTHSAILTNEGRILTAGSSTAGEWRGLGRNTKNGTELDFMPVVEVYSLSDASSSTTTSTTTSTTMNNNGEMNAQQHSMITTRTSSSTFPQFVKVVASQYYTFALDTMGNVWSTGNNAYSQLCLNDTTTSTSSTTSRNRFHQIPMPHRTATTTGTGNKANLFDRWNNKVIDIALGERHALLLTQGGRVYGCGWNVYGQLGLGAGVMMNGGRSVGSPTEIVFHTVPSNNDTEVGGDAGGAIGGGRNGSIITTVVDDEERNMNREVVTDIVAGRGSSYFLTESGHVYATGTNYKGQLCLGHRNDKSTPTMLAHVENFLHGTDGNTMIIDDFSLHDEGVGVSAIAAAHSSFYLLLTNGMLLACGENTHGELGIGNNGKANNNYNNNKVDNANNWITAEYVPTIIANVSNVTAVFSGPLSYGAYFVSDRIIYAVGFDGYAGAPRENWNVPTMMACADESTSVERGVVISTGNDVTLYLATEETTFECTGDDGIGGEYDNNSTDGSALAMKPTVSLEPTGSHVPTVSMSPTGRPSISSSPTVTTAPTSSSSPTSDATEGDTDETVMPTFMPTGPSMEGGVVTGSPQLQSPPRGEGRSSSNGAEGYSPYGFEVSYLLGASLIIIWQWL
eukprot:CAMPEP_0196130412 /NCGR_PEP_ID=MMETSP0910-20130528/790_1 /TAXON_ID=49265 /ORGANISM="Thalassiosira rotula, Strain GSO102" /LENGTH=794 /DNA_ID=CAMNT_0041389709 /DNA_START=307 /DNA_END=2691 /DNA_ORIENTATION=+